MKADETHTAALPSAADTFLRELARAPARALPGMNLQEEQLNGEVIDGKYRVEALLGHGGMGAVYEATHLGTGRTVALKVLVPELTANEGAIERFKREALATGRLRHPNVVDITDFGFAERGGVRLAYLVMELLRGKTLRAQLDAEGPMTVDTALDVLDQVCAAVSEAHAQGILHRDIKPENIHLGPGDRERYRVKVLDFGIAKLVEPHSAPRAPPLSSDGPPVALDDASLAATVPRSTERWRRRSPLYGARWRSRIIPEMGRSPS